MSAAGSNDSAGQRDAAVNDAEARDSGIDQMLDTTDAPAAQDATFDADLTTEGRRRMISEAAYYIAERRGFDGGFELDDWLQAEAEVEALMASRRQTSH
jgi:hypothetical protein